LLKLNTYTYDSNNKLTQLVGPSGTTTFGYDDNGNTSSMTAPGPITTNYGYDYENRLASVSNPSYTAAYTYSADGLRLRAQESNHPYPDRWFLYAGALPFCEGTLSGDTYTSNKTYIREGLSYYDPLVFSSVGGYRRHYLYDGLGSTRQLLNDSQTVTDTYSYEAFGNLTASTGTTANPYKYVGSLGYYGPTAGGGSSLQHLGARYYMPEVGRFVQPDALERATYCYCNSNPINCVDPTGWVECKKPPVTKETCRKACIEWYDPEGKKPWKYEDKCRNFCKKLKGDTCVELQEWCEDLERHWKTHKEAQICWGVYEKLCG